MNRLVNRLLGVALLAVAGSAAFAQSYHHSLGLSVGTFHIRTLDQQASPLRYAGTLWPLYGFTYRHHTDQSQLTVRLSGGAGTMNPERFGARTYSTKFGDGTPFSYQISSELYHLDLEADYLRRVGGAEPTGFDTWVGGAVRESLLFADEVANFPWMVNTATLAPVWQTDYTGAASHSLTLRIDLAVIGLITRAIWAGYPKSTGDNNVTAYIRQGTRPAAVGKLGHVNVQLNYAYRLSPRLSVGTSYRARYLSYPDPRPIRALTRSLALEGEVHL